MNTKQINEAIKQSLSKKFNSKKLIEVERKKRESLSMELERQRINKNNNK
jgi:hypothetical protein